MYPQAVGMAGIAVVGAVDAHCQAAKHSQAQTQQDLQIGSERRQPAHDSPLMTDQPKVADSHKLYPTQRCCRQCRTSCCATA
jgi:hypothetical protein